MSALFGILRTDTHRRRIVLPLIAALIVTGASACAGASPSAPSAPPASAPSLQRPDVTAARATDTPTPEPATPTPSPSLAVTPTPDPGLTARINSWLTGATSVPTSLLWHTTGDAALNREQINIAPDSIGGIWYENWSGEFQVYFLGTQVININGVPHLEAYLGQIAGKTPGKGARYVIRVNLGPYDATHVSVFCTDATRTQLLTGPRSIVNTIEAEALLPEQVGNTGTIIMEANHSILSEDPRIASDEKTAADQTAIDLVNFSIKAMNTDLQTALATYPNLKDATVLASPIPKGRALDSDNADLSRLPYVVNFKVTSLPERVLFQPSQLPVTVTSSEDYSKNSFVLAPGTYTVAYTASGTCDFDPSVSIVGSVSIPVVHRSVDSQQVSGSVSITVPKLGRSTIYAGSSGCDWSVTISQP